MFLCICIDISYINYENGNVKNVSKEILRYTNKGMGLSQQECGNGLW